MLTSWRIVWTVLCKEVVENLRDRRAMFSAFLFVPLLGPLLFAGMTTFMVERVVGEADERLRLPMIGTEFSLQRRTVRMLFRLPMASIKRVQRCAKVASTLSWSFQHRSARNFGQENLHRWK
jgi:hypothetical protein